MHVSPCKIPSRASPRVALQSASLALDTREPRRRSHQARIRISCHPRSCFVGLVKGELIRLSLTNSQKNTYEKHVALFFQKLALRGYPAVLMNDCRKQFSWAAKYEILSRRPEKSRVLSLTPPYIHGAEKLGITGILNKRWTDSRVRVLLSFFSGASLFRLRYGRFFSCLAKG